MSDVEPASSPKDTSYSKGDGQEVKAAVGATEPLENKKLDTHTGKTDMVLLR